MALSIWEVTKAVHFILTAPIGPYRPNEMVGHDLIWRLPKCNYIFIWFLQVKSIYVLRNPFASIFMRTYIYNYACIGKQLLSRRKWIHWSLRVCPKDNALSEKQLKLKVSMCQVSTLHPNFLRLTSYKNILICIHLIESKAWMVCFD